MKKNCINCGIELDKDEAFCHKCGHAVNAKRHFLSSKKMIAVLAVTVLLAGCLGVLKIAGAFEKKGNQQDGSIAVSQANAFEMKDSALEQEYLISVKVFADKDAAVSCIEALKIKGYLRFGLAAEEITGQTGSKVFLRGYQNEAEAQKDLAAIRAMGYSEAEIIKN
ncbi:DUF2116 family Zn-ribbon domain-containing protein [Eubacterium limosum]|uniref:DUF2116 family Zn-ribbon domain-containing protein n=1 Tax=Eubacterium limosum TaxID=1736 RepID=UPI0022E74F61|nr:DUF2116 family Zn-ribbon domain-containing protein [Eubacterium limosum]